MDDASIVAIFYSVDKLAKIELGTLFGETPGFRKKIKQFAVGTMFEYDVNGRFCRQYFKKGDDVGMTKLTVVMDFTSHKRCMLFADLLDGDLASGDLMDTQFNFTKSSLIYNLISNNTQFVYIFLGPMAVPRLSSPLWSSTRQRSF